MTHSTMTEQPLPLQSLFEQDATIWENVRNEAESWLGTPYRHLQRCKGRGADCTLFIGQVLLNTNLLMNLEYGYYPRDWHQHTQDEYVLDGAYKHIREHMKPGITVQLMPKDTPLQRGDWLAFSTTARGVSNHCGLVWPDAERTLSRMLHAINERGVSFTPLGNWWLRRMTHHFRIISL